jgi:hypothetical protein
MFDPRDKVTHFVVRARNGTTVDYRTIWQKDQLLLICLDDTPASAALTAIADELAGRPDDFRYAQSQLVVTGDEVPGAPRPGVLVADRWGDVYAAIDAASVTSADDLIDWLRFMQRKCG